MNNHPNNGYENHLTDAESRWFAIYTRFRSEKEVARLLKQKGIEVYVPVVRVIRQYTRKRKVLDIPLINCYAFVKIKKKEYVSVLETNHVIKFIKFSANLISIPDREISLLKRICQENPEVQVESLSFSAGQKVEIIGGSLTGIRGKLIRQNGKNFLVELDHIGFGLQMEVEPAFLQPIGNLPKKTDPVTQEFANEPMDWI